jgi:capsular polysaccharide biosynthesis protein
VTDPSPAEVSPRRAAPLSPLPQQGATGPGPSTGRRRPADWLWIGLACFVIVTTAVVSAVVVGSRGADVYGARADILYVAPDAPLDVRQRSLATQGEVARSRAVLAAAAAQEGVPLDQLQDAVSVETGVQDDLLHITVSDEDRGVARRLAQAVATSYLGLAARVEGADARSRIRLLSPAYPLDDRLSPKPLRAAAVGLLLGLVLATGVAILLARRMSAR